ncbi:MAG: hypothetical protein LLG44_09730 [Chloroflexi bacterium]|nr:hypothetical protein [Chloroflexota bacterium]
MFPFFSPFRRHGYHMHFGCLGGLLRLVLVALGIKYVTDHTQGQRSTQIWPPQPAQPTQPVQPTAQPAQPTAGHDTAKLNGDNLNPWVDKVQ